MRDRSMSLSFLSLFAAVLLGVGIQGAAAQGLEVGWPSDPCADVSGGDRATHCEVREQAISATAGVNVNARPNGSITVRGWNRQDAQMRARVVTHAETDAEARSLASAVQVLADGGRVRAEGPRGEGGSGWSVSFELMVPLDATVELEATNGSISIADMAGRVRFHTTNGSVKLLNVNGQVQGSTTNGSVKVELQGAGWNGDGLNVQTTNGSIKFAVPSGYGAQLEAETNMGSIKSELPVEMEGRFHKRVSGVLGAGGAPVSLRTTNGSISVETRQ